MGLSVAFLSAAAVTALASDRQPLGAGPDVTIQCPQGYTGVLHDQVNAEYQMEHVDRYGNVRWQFDGRLLETFTNTSTGKVLSFNGSGPATVTFFTDGSVTAVFEGLTVRIRPYGLWVFTGRVTVDPTNGNILTDNGKIRDICAELA